MPIYIQNIATSVPDTSVEQSLIRDKMKEYVNDQPVTRRIIHRIYSHSGIEKRHTVADDFHADGQPPLFFKKDGALGTPSTKTRNDLYIRHAKKHFVEVAEKLLAENKQISKENITHVITVSCTGFFAPEPAYEVVKNLNLSPSTQRFHIGFMGCFAAFPALKMAQAFCRADPDAAVMVICLELCTLHLQDSTATDQLISGSVFADGAAGAIVSSGEPSARQPAYRIEHFQTAIAAQSEEDMAWKIGNAGFEMVLSTAVPDIIQGNLRESIAPLLDAYDLAYDEVDHWPVHPGGRAILDKIEQNLHLDPSQIAPSRTVLSQYGNMSSATILFVLRELLRCPASQPEEKALAMAFGPGLTIESGLLTKVT
jgi:predicted naringenin-chalcone synthase